MTGDRGSSTLGGVTDGRRRSAQDEGHGETQGGVEPSRATFGVTASLASGRLALLTCKMGPSSRTSQGCCDSGMTGRTGHLAQVHGGAREGPALPFPIRPNSQHLKIPFTREKAPDPIGDSRDKGTGG